MEQCEIYPKMNCSECEVVKACEKCLNKITQSKYRSIEFNKLKRFCENELG